MIMKDILDRIINPHILTVYKRAVLNIANYGNITMASAYFFISGAGPQGNALLLRGLSISNTG